MAVPDRLRGFFASRRAVAVMALVCIALMLISVNIIAARLFAWRLDLTGEHLYTLSRGTLRTLARIDEPITLRFYYSTRLADEVPSYGVYAQRVRELLDQYVAAAHGKIRLEVYNPLPFSDVEDRAVAFGLQGVPLDVRRRAGLFRARRDQLDRRPAGHRVLPARARALSRIRSDQARPQPGVSEEDRGRLDQHVAARRRHDGDDARPSGRADGHHGAIAAARYGQAAGRQHRCDPARCRCADARASAEPAGQDAVCDRPVRPERRQGAGLCRSALRTAGLASEPAQSARLADRQQSRTAVQILGLRGAGEYGRRRSPRRATGRRAGLARRNAAARLHRLAQSEDRQSQSHRHDHGRSEPRHDGFLRDHRADRGRQDDDRAADHDIARTR